MIQLELFPEKNVYVIFPFGGMYRQCYGPFSNETEAIKFLEEELETQEIAHIVQCIGNWRG